MDAMMRRRSPRGREKGFTLLEVVVALGILAVGLLGAGAMQLHAMRGGSNSRHHTQASSIARVQLEQFSHLPFSDAGLAPTGTAWAPSPALVVSRTVQSANGAVAGQSYSVQWRIADLNAGPTLKAIDVRVTWSEPNRPNRTVTLSTVRYEN